MNQVDYQGQCPKCLNHGMRPGVHKKTRIATMIFCDCELGKNMLHAAQQNPRNCPFCRPGKGEVQIGGKSPHSLQCPHVRPDDYEPLITNQDKPDIYACVDR